MIENVWLYSSLPLVAALCCLYLLKKLIAKNASIDYTLLFLNLALINLAQSVGYIVLSSSIEIGTYFADLYWFALYFFFPHLLLFAWNLSDNSIKKSHRKFIYLFPAALIMLHLFGFIVDGYTIQQNTPMHNDGSLAWVLDAFIVAVSGAVAIKFISGAFFNAKYNQVLRTKNLIACISFIPLVLIFAVIILLSTTKYAVPFVIIIPAVTINTAFWFYLTSYNKAFNKTMVINSAARLKICYLYLFTENESETINKIKEDIDKLSCIEALEAHNYDIIKAAESMRMKTTTLRYKIKKYNIEEPTTEKIGRESI